MGYVKKFSFVVLSVVVLGAAFFIIRIVLFSGKVSTDDAQVDGHLVFISPRVSGTVMRVLVNDNQVVKKGDLLAVLDPKDYEARLESAEAQLILAKKQLQAAILNVPVTHISTRGTQSQAQASLERNMAEEKAAEKHVSELEETIAKTSADLSSAKSRLSLAESNYNRMKVLFRTYVASQQQFDSARTAYEDARAAVKAQQALQGQSLSQLQESSNQLEAAKASVEEARALLLAASAGPEQVMIRKAEAGAGKGSVLAAKAMVRLDKLQLLYTKVRAPSAGMIINKQATEGEVVAQGQQLMALSPETIWVTANFKETDLARIKQGDKTELALDAFPGKVFYGKVDSVSAATGSATSLFPPENATGNFVKVVQRIPVKIIFDPNQDVRSLRIGMSVVATVSVH